jgi:hypothetical protein
MLLFHFMSQPQYAIVNGVQTQTVVGTYTPWYGVLLEIILGVVALVVIVGIFVWASDL